MKDLKKAIEVLKAGGVIIYPTDTVYGIGCDATNPKAIRKLYALKNRDLKQPVSISTTMEQIEKFCIISKEAKSILEKHLPGALTAVFRPNTEYRLPSQILEDEISVRIPNHPFVLALLKEIDFPIISTSANISGEPSPTRFDEIKVKADLNIEGDEFVRGTPSTIVDFTEEPFKVLRQGALKL